MTNTTESKNMAGRELSVILPVYNEVDNIEPMHEEIMQALDPLNIDYEIVYVDDGSSDGTLDRLRKIQLSSDRVRLVLFRRNFGQTAAMAAGFDYANGDVIVTMDADRQNDPKDIPMMLERITSGSDLVCGWRYHRQDGFLLRRLPSIIANKLISFITDVNLHDYGCTLKAFKNDVAKNIGLYGEMHRFIPAIASWMGVSIEEVKVNHRPRVAGTSKYGISRTIRVVLDLITVKYLLSFAGRPLQFFGSIGLISGMVGFFVASYLTVQRLFFGMPLSDRPLLWFAILLIFIGLQFITFGLLAEVQTRTYHESQKKPTYVVREVIG